MRSKWLGLYVLVALFLGSWVGQFVTQIQVVRSEAAEHGQAFDWQDFLYQFGASTLENWQSEFLQLAVQALIVGVFASTVFRAYDDAQKQSVKEAVREALDEWEDDDQWSGSTQG